jgi:hypothetical protein
VANNAVLRTIDLTSAWVPLADEPLVANVNLLMISTGGFADMASTFLIRQGTAESCWPINDPVQLSGVDLSTIEVCSTYSNVRLLLIGNTR